MVIAKLLLLALGLMWVGYAGWSTPFLLREKDADTSASIFTDSSTGKAYAFYGVTRREPTLASFVCFREISPTDQVSAEMCVKQERVVVDVSASCANNGKSFYAVYSARRHVNETLCEYVPMGGNKTKGCFDVYFIESHDAGKTWTQALAMPRTDLDDMVHRREPKLLSITETGRLFVVYSKELPDLAYYKFFATVTRPKNTSVFTLENVPRILWDMPLNNKTFTYIVSGGTLQISLIIEPVTYSFQRRYSNNNGLNWELDSLPLGRWVRYAVSMSQHKDRLYLLANMNDYVLRLMWLGSNNKWTYKDLQNIDHNLYPIVADTTTEKPSILLTGQINSTHVSTYTYDVETDTLTDLNEVPPLSPGREASTLYDGKSCKVRVMHTMNNSLYFSTHF